MKGFLNVIAVGIGLLFLISVAFTQLSAGLDSNAAATGKAAGNAIADFIEAAFLPAVILGIAYGIYRLVMRFRKAA